MFEFSLKRLFGFGPGQTRVWKLSIRQWVWLFAGLSTALQIFIAILCAEEFRQGSYDLGVSIQGFSNVGHGRFFWSTGNYLHKGTVSLLNSHFSWVYFGFYPLYTEFPGQTTLFVIQAVPIALAAIPLEALATEASGSPRRGLLVAGLYMAWAPMYAGMPNSFHLEAFLPVLFFSLVLVWRRKQYVLGLVLAVITGFTLDVAPAFIALLALMFLTYPLQAAIRTFRKKSTATPTAGAGGIKFWTSSVYHRLTDVMVSAVRSREVQACFGLILVAAVVFLSMRYLEAHFTAWLGIHGNSLSILRNPGSSISHLSIGFEGKVLFWLMMGATVGFLPLLYPRILILLVPWMGYTFLQALLAWYSFTSHYVAIAAVPLFIGAALGIGALPLSPPSVHPEPTGASGPRVYEEDEPPTAGGSQDGLGTDRPVPEPWSEGQDRPTIGGTPESPPVSEIPSSPRRHRAWSTGGRAGLPRWVYTGSVLLVIGVLAGNIGINPANFATNGLIAATRNPTVTGSGGGVYSLTWDPGPSYRAVVGLAGEIPPKAHLLFESTFYPVIGSDPNAYTYVPAHLQNGGVQRSPFNNTTLPDFVLATRKGLNLFNNIVGNISAEVWNQSLYGVPGWVQSTRFGSVYLFERGYTGPTRNFGPVSYPQIDFVAGSTLKPGPAGRLGMAHQNNSTVAVISSARDRTGRMWIVSDLQQSLPEGHYYLVLDVRSNGNRSNCANTLSSSTVLDIEGYVPRNLPLFDVPITHLELPCGKWVQVSVPFDLTYPVARIIFVGLRPSMPLPITLNVASVDLVPIGPLSN